MLMPSELAVQRQSSLLQPARDTPRISRAVARRVAVNEDRRATGLVNREGTNVSLNSMLIELFLLGGMELPRLVA